MTKLWRIMQEMHRGEQEPLLAFLQQPMQERADYPASVDQLQSLFHAG